MKIQLEFFAKVSQDNDGSDGDHTASQNGREAPEENTGSLIPQAFLKQNVQEVRPLKPIGPLNHAEDDTEKRKA